MEMEDRVIYSSFNPLQHCKNSGTGSESQHRHPLRRCYLRCRELCEKIGTGALHPATFHVQMADFLQQYVESDLAVHVWTVNDKAEIERLMEAGC